MSDFNINENAEVFDDGPKKQHIVVKILKWLALGIVALICLLLFYRCVTSVDHPIVKKVLMNSAFIDAYEEGEEVLVQQYGMQSAWVSVDQGRLIEFNYLYHIPTVNQLQFSMKYNHDIVKGKFEGIPFKLRLVDEDGNVFEDYFFETASRERFRYVRVCFENIQLKKDELDENGNNLRHTYLLEIDMVNEKGEYEPLCKYEIYDGDSGRSSVFKNIDYKVEK